MVTEERNYARKRRGREMHPFKAEEREQRRRL
jgi:hypothetical protein